MDVSLSFLETLNPAQLKAVQHDESMPTQILAGPGSGKTKVLTSRIAYLILARSLEPSSICAVTFTNKAANEMRVRLTQLIGQKATSDVTMGTFHSLCATFLRKHGSLVGLRGNFIICDAEESKKIVSKLVKERVAFIDRDINLKDDNILSIISKAKAQGQNAEEFSLCIREDRQGEKASKVSRNVGTFIAHIYQEYEKALRRSNSLDFDDLLLYGVRLFTDHEEARTWCKHVLVDEFQDTNIIQYNLMRALAAHQCVTVVGDPDQSIYSWRSAEVGNLTSMKQDFPGTVQILLEQNYRSTGSILDASLAIVSQDSARIPKSLRTDNPKGFIPVVQELTSEHEEADFAAYEIKRLTAEMGGMLHWNDFAILIRSNALSRAFETSLQKNGIPCRILGGHKFLERAEVKNLLAYLQLIDNPEFDPAFIRAVNVPSRGIGIKTLAEISSRAELKKISQLQLVQGICNGRLPDIKPPARRKLASFFGVMNQLRGLAEAGATPSNLIRRLLELTEFKLYLKKTEPDWESRWENTQELITFATEVEQNLNNARAQDDDISIHTPLRLFLQASMLSSEGDNQPERTNEACLPYFGLVRELIVYAQKVTISTCHAAKGLEWPVVIIPAVEQGIFPSYRTEDVDEERRLLFVACTRAQAVLYLTHVKQRKVAGETRNKEVSEFLSTLLEQSPTLFTTQRPRLYKTTGQAVISNLLRRPIPDASEASRQIVEFMQSMHPKWGEAVYNPRVTTSQRSADFTSVKALIEPSEETSCYQPQPAKQSAQLRATLNECPPLSMKQPADMKSHPSMSNPAPPHSSDGTTHKQPKENMPINAGPHGMKRRLGIGRPVTGYQNKKFKPPM